MAKFLLRAVIMLPTDRQKTALKALKAMHADLIHAMELATKSCSPKVPASPFTFEFFLCGLYLHNRSRALDYFQRDEPYKQMVREFCGDDADRPILRRALDDFLKREALSISIPFDEQFIDILCQALDFSLAQGRQTIELDDMMRTLGSNKAVADQLFNHRGLRLKAFAT